MPRRTWPFPRRVDAVETRSGCGGGGAVPRRVDAEVGAPQEGIAVRTEARSSRMRTARRQQQKDLARVRRRNRSVLSPLRAMRANVVCERGTARELGLAAWACGARSDCRLVERGGLDSG